MKDKEIREALNDAELRDTLSRARRDHQSRSRLLDKSESAAIFTACVIIAYLILWLFTPVF